MTNEVTLTVRVIRSFEHRNIRPIVLRDVSLEIDARAFLDLVLSTVRNRSTLPSVVRNYDYDTLKIMHKAHGAKCNDPIINIDDDDRLVLKAELSLIDNDVEHETELSLFRADDYIRYKQSKNQA